MTGAPARPLRGRWGAGQSNLEGNPAVNRWPALILPDCAPAVRLFLTAQTQWRIGGLGTVYDLDYAAFRAAADAIGVAWSADLLDRLRVLESVATAALARKRSAEDGM